VPPYFAAERCFHFGGTPGLSLLIFRAVSEPGTIQGHPIGEAKLAQVRALLAGHPDWSRHRIFAFGFLDDK
jgi:hypothetical protein